MEQKSYDDEIDLIQLFGLLRRNKLRILGVMVFVILIAIFYCLLATRLYEIDAQVRPGVTGYDTQGGEIRSLKPQTIKFWFVRKAYASKIAKILPDTSQNLNIKATTNKKSDAVDITFYWKDGNKGIHILSKLLEIFSEDLNKNLQQELEVHRKKLAEQISKLKLSLQQTYNKAEKIKGNIKQKQNDISLIKTMLITLEKNQAELEKAKHRIEQQVKTIYKNTGELIELRKDIIKAGSKAGVDKFALLMYSNIVQQNITYITNLEQRLAALEKEINEFLVKKTQNEGKIKAINIEIQKLQAVLEKEIPLQQNALEKRIDFLKAKERTLQPLEILQTPFSSPGPVKPRVKLIIALSVVVGLVLGIFYAFLHEMLKNLKTNEQTNEQ